MRSIFAATVAVVLPSVLGATASEEPPVRLRDESDLWLIVAKNCPERETIVDDLATFKCSQMLKKAKDEFEKKRIFDKCRDAVKSSLDRIPKKSTFTYQVHMVAGDYDFTKHHYPLNFGETGSTSLRFGELVRKDESEIDATKKKEIGIYISNVDKINRISLDEKAAEEILPRISSDDSMYKKVDVRFTAKMDKCESSLIKPKLTFELNRPPEHPYHRLRVTVISIEYLDRNGVLISKVSP